MHIDAPAYVRQGLADQRVAALAEGLLLWPGEALSSHKSARQLFHHLVLLSDLGLDVSVPVVRTVCDRVLDSFGPDGIPALVMNIGAAHGGTGEDTRGWALCDAPNTLYGLKALGCAESRIDKAAELLAGSCRSNGFGCVVSPVLGKWRGPGKQADPCPYATLIMLKLLLRYGERYRSQIDSCVQSLLGLWQNSREQHPYMFYMGEDFRKLKLPFIWYDILHVLEVLSQDATARADRRFRELLDCVHAKRGPGGYVPESVYQFFKAWDFGQKKTVSEFMNWRISLIEARLANTERPGE